MTDQIAHYASDHARTRATERLGFAPTLDDWRDTALCILDTVAGRPRALLLRRSGRCEQWRVAIAGRAVTVGWAPERAVVVTVLT